MPGGKALLQLLHLVLDRARRPPGRWSRAAGRPTGPPTACRRACRSGRRTGRPARCWPRPEADDAAVGVGLEDDVGELLGVRPAGPAWSWCTGTPGRWASAAGRSGRPPPGCSAAAMALITSLAVRLQRRHLLRVEPEPHAVVALAEVGDVADARQARQLVAELDGGVVAQVEAVAAARRARTG